MLDFLEASRAKLECHYGISEVSLCLRANLQQTVVRQVLDPLYADDLAEDLVNRLVGRLVQLENFEPCMRLHGSVEHLVRK